MMHTHAKLNIAKVTKVEVGPILFDNPRHKTTDYRRKIVMVHFDNGYTWSPRYTDMLLIRKALDEAFKHNIQFPDPDKNEV